MRWWPAQPSPYAALAYAPPMPRDSLSPARTPALSTTAALAVSTFTNAYLQRRSRLTSLGPEASLFAAHLASNRPGSQAVPILPAVRVFPVVPRNSKVPVMPVPIKSHVPDDFWGTGCTSSAKPS